tara:strand:+ start:1408 stop:2169 length:762 start_codon:yes stop_codon:yes gene_type:complete
MIDSHCHLDYEPLFTDIKNVIKRSQDIGIEKILTICTTIQSYEKIIRIINENEIVFGTFGIHPHEVENNFISTNVIITNIKQNKKIIGIGETGLDFYYNNADKEKQILSFKNHLEAAAELNIPVIVHSRNAETETFNILNEFKSKNLKILMHCFTGSREFAEKLLDFNTYFSASGIITFKNSIELQNTFKFIPLDRLLIETDSPYLAPVPQRGKKNEPSFLKFTANKLADLRDMKNDELISKTTANFNKLFKN